MTSISAAQRSMPPNRFAPIERLRFALKALDPIRLPPYAGSAWRGLLGHGLRRSVCVTHQPVCDGCMLRQTCLYSTFFESPGETFINGQRYDRLPHPFVLEPDPGAPREMASGDRLGLGVTLFGAFTAQAPYLIHAVAAAGDRGLGQGGGRFVVSRLERETALGEGRWETAWEPASGDYRLAAPVPGAIPGLPGQSLRLSLVTPLRVKRKGHFLGARDFTAEALLWHLCARLELLARLYGGDPDAFDWNGLAAQAGEVRIGRADLRWHDWTRYSSRQGTLMQMGGLLGELTLEGPGLATFWPALWLGQWVHVGKGTSFGLGWYRLQGQ